MPKILYEFNPETAELRFQIEGFPNQGLRCVLLGIWRRMERGDQEDFIEELKWYLNRPDAELPPLSRVLATVESNLDVPLAGKAPVIHDHEEFTSSSKDYYGC